MLMKQNKITKFLSERPLTAVFIFVLVCLLPEMLVRDFTPSNELRYLSIADEAIADGHVFAFYNHGLAYADKPPLYIWIVMLCRVVFGHHSMFALSLFSLIPAFVITWVMDKWVMSKASASDRMAMAMMMLSCAMFLGTMAVLRMDMLMCMFIVLALYAFWRVYELGGEEASGEDKKAAVKYVWQLSAFIFLALFTKGPVGLLVPILSINVFLLVKRQWKYWTKFMGWRPLLVLLAGCAVWFGCAWFEGGTEYIDNLLFKQTAGRAVNAFTHSKPFWYYLVAILWCISPYTLLLVGSLISSLWPAKRGEAEIPASSLRSDKEVLFLCVALSTFVMLSSFSSKLAIYLVPIFPFVVYLFPLVVNRLGCRKWVAWSIVIPSVILLVAGVAVLLVVGRVVSLDALSSLEAEAPYIFSPSVKFAAILLVAGNMLCLYFLFRRRHWNLPIFMIGTSMFLMIYSASGVLNQANAYIGYAQLCKEVPEDTDVVTLFVHRPENMDVYLGRQVIDYKKDASAFLEDLQDGGKLSGKAFTLIVKTSRMESDDALREFVYGSGVVAYAGQYCVVTHRVPEKND